jgi:hypothetical protein
MSLWDKWEKEKMERHGIRVERKSDVDIRDTRPKADVRKQTLVVSAAVLACFVVVYCAWLLNEMYSGHWSDLYIIRVIAEKTAWRIGSDDTQ